MSRQALRIVADNRDVPPSTPEQRILRKLRFAAAMANRFASHGDDMLKRSIFAELARKLDVAIELAESRQRPEAS
jgi:hypothetical protein